MIRSRTVRLAAIAVLGSAVLAGTTGCGGPKEAGVAITADGTSTTDRQVQDRVAELQKVETAYGADITKIEQALQAQGNASGPATTDPGRDQVKQIADEALWAKAATLVGATATAKDDSTQLENLAQSAMSAFTATQISVKEDNEVKIAILAQGFGINLAPGGVAGYAHTSALQHAVILAVAQKINADPTTYSQPGPLATALQELVAKAATEISFKVSPRYAGSVTLDPQSLSMDLGASATPVWVKAGQDQKAVAPVAPQDGQQQPQS